VGRGETKKEKKQTLDNIVEDSGLTIGGREVVHEGSG